MPIYIQTGGAGAQLGAGLGAGFSKGMEQGLADAKQAKKDAQLMQAIQVGLDTTIAQADAQTPGLDPGMATMIPTGLPAAAGGMVPAYLNPGPSEGQRALDEAAEAHRAAFSTITDPEAAQAYLQVAQQDLQQMTQQEAGRRVSQGIQNALAANKVSEEEVAPILEALMQGADPGAAYEAWGSLRASKAEEAKRGRRALRLTTLVGHSAQRFEQASKDSEDPEESMWLQQQSEKLAELAAEVEDAIAMGLDDFDYEAAYARWQDTKYALNPVQERRRAVEQEAIIEQVKGVFSAVRDMVGAEDIQGALGMIDGLLGGTFEATPLPTQQAVPDVGGQPAPRPTMAPSPEGASILPAGTKTWDEWQALPKRNREAKQSHAATVLSRELLGDGSDAANAFMGLTPAQLDGASQYVMARLGVDPGQADEAITKDLQRLPKEALRTLSAINAAMRKAKEDYELREKLAAERAGPRSHTLEPNRAEPRPPAMYLMGNQ